MFKKTSENSQLDIFTTENYLNGTFLKFYNAERFKASAKKLPEKVFFEMQEMYEAVSDDEGFDLIITV